MAYYKAIVSYDGTNYQGWQSQNHGNTIQDTIIRSYKNTFFSNITIAGASRTDSGVHALGQVIGIDISLDLAEEKLIKILNDNLPKDILIKNLRKWWRPDKEKNIEVISEGGWHFNNILSPNHLSPKPRIYRSEKLISPF